MRSEHSGVLDANALFGDLPCFVTPPSQPIEPPPSTVRVPRRAETTARTERPVDPMRARLISVIVCGSVALVAALFACFLYVKAPPSLSVAQHGAAAQASR